MSLESVLMLFLAQPEEGGDSAECLALYFAPVDEFCIVIVLIFSY